MFVRVCTILKYWSAIMKFILQNRTMIAKTSPYFRFCVKLCMTCSCTGNTVKIGFRYSLQNPASSSHPPLTNKRSYPIVLFSQVNVRTRKKLNKGSKSIELRQERFWPQTFYTTLCHPKRKKIQSFPSFLGLQTVLPINVRPTTVITKERPQRRDRDSFKSKNGTNFEKKGKFLKKG